MNSNRQWAHAFSFALLLSACGLQVPTSLPLNDQGGLYRSTAEFLDPVDGAWTGRLILPKPEERRPDGGVWFEVYTQPGGQSGRFVGQRLWLAWETDELGTAFTRRTTIDIDFSKDPKHVAKARESGDWLPERVNGWKNVSALETLAGTRARTEPVGGIETSDSVEVYIPSARLAGATLYTASEPVQVVGREAALVKFVGPARDGTIEVQHYDLAQRRFAGPTEVVTFQKPTLRPPGSMPRSSFVNIEKKALNEWGWYVFGEHLQGKFHIRAIEPRRLSMVQPEQTIAGREASKQFLQNENFAYRDEASKGTHSITLLHPEGEPPRWTTDWQRGDRALVVHAFGAIGGQFADKPAGTLPVLGEVYTGHFSFGVAKVYTDPFTASPRFDIEYKQVYAHGPDGVLSGSSKWHAYMGDLQRGWAFVRPVADLLIRQPALSTRITFPNGKGFHPLDALARELEIMSARYRSGDGTGVSPVTPATSCVQDSNQGVYVAVRQLEKYIKDNPDIAAWGEEHATVPVQQRFTELLQIAKLLEANLMPDSRLRTDWPHSLEQLAIHRDVMEDPEVYLNALINRRIVLPRWAFDNTALSFLDTRRASLWLIHTRQIGGDIDGIFPIAPGFRPVPN